MNVAKIEPQTDPYELLSDLLMPITDTLFHYGLMILVVFVMLKLIEFSFRPRSTTPRRKDEVSLAPVEPPLPETKPDVKAVASKPTQQIKPLFVSGPMRPEWWHHLVPWGLRYFVNTSVVLGYYLAPWWRRLCMTPWGLQRWVDRHGQFSDEISQTLALLPNINAARQVDEVGRVNLELEVHACGLRQAAVRYWALYVPAIEREDMTSRHSELIKALEN